MIVEILRTQIRSTDVFSLCKFQPTRECDRLGTLYGEAPASPANAKKAPRNFSEIIIHGFFFEKIDTFSTKILMKMKMKFLQARKSMGFSIKNLPANLEAREKSLFS